MNPAVSVALLCVFLSSAQPSDITPSAAATSASDDALMTELAEIDARSADIKDLTADFEQQKFTSLLKEPLTSEGRVRFSPPRTRWDTSRPRKSVLLLDERELKLFDPEAKTLEVFEVTDGLSRMMSSPVPRLSSVKDEFSIERIDPAAIEDSASAESFVAIRLTPADEEVAEHVTEVRVLIDRALACAIRVEVTDADGDRTVIRFKDLRLNSGIDAESLDLLVPEGTRVTRPLQGEAGSGGAR